MHGHLLTNDNFADCPLCQRTMSVVKSGLRPDGSMRSVYSCMTHKGRKHSFLRGSIFLNSKIGMSRMIEIITAFANEGESSAVDGRIC